MVSNYVKNPLSILIGEQKKERTKTLLQALKYVNKCKML